MIILLLIIFLFLFLSNSVLCSSLIIGGDKRSNRIHERGRERERGKENDHSQNRGHHSHKNVTVSWRREYSSKAPTADPCFRKWFTITNTSTPEYILKLAESKGNMYEYVYDVSEKTTHKGYNAIKIVVGLYKIMDCYYTEEYEEKYYERGEPSWYASSGKAVQGLPQRWGGIHAYKTLKPSINVLVVDCDNIKKLIGLVKSDARIRGKNMKEWYIKNILRLSACSEKGLEHQYEVYNSMYGYDGVIWLTEYDEGIGLKKDDTNYFGLVRDKGRYNYDLAYILAFLNETHSMGFDGYIVKALYTPYMSLGTSFEEVVLFYPGKAIKRNTADPLDWTSYQNILPFKVIENSKVPQNLTSTNINFILNIMYEKPLDSEENRMIVKKSKEFKHNILFLDLKIGPVYQNIDNVDSIYDELIKFCDPECVIFNTVEEEFTVKGRKKFYQDDKVGIMNNTRIYKKVPEEELFKKVAEENATKVEESGKDIVYGELSCWCRDPSGYEMVNCSVSTESDRHPKKINHTFLAVRKGIKSNADNCLLIYGKLFTRPAMLGFD